MPASFIKHAMSFDKYATADLPFIYPSVSTNWTVSSGTGRRPGQNSMKCIGGTAPWEIAAGSYQFHMMSFAVQPTLWDTQLLCGVREGTTNHVSIKIDNGGILRAYRDTTELATSGVTIPKVGYTHIQVLFGVHNSTGIVKVRLNGNATPVIDFTGDTQNGGTATGDRAAHGPSNGREYCDFIYQASNTVGDLVYYDDAAVISVSPASNDTVNGTPTGGTNAAVVADTSQSTYVDMLDPTPTLNFDLFNIDDLPAGISTVHAVSLKMLARKDPAGGLTITSKLLTSQAGTPYLGSTLFTQGSSLALCEEIWDEQPATGAWDVTAFNAMKTGYQRES